MFGNITPVSSQGKVLEAFHPETTLRITQHAEAMKLDQDVSKDRRAVRQALVVLQSHPMDRAFYAYLSAQPAMASYIELPEGVSVESLSDTDLQSESDALQLVLATEVHQWKHMEPGYKAPPTTEVMTKRALRRKVGAGAIMAALVISGGLFIRKKIRDRQVLGSKANLEHLLEQASAILTTLRKLKSVRLLSASSRSQFIADLRALNLNTDIVEIMPEEMDSFVGNYVIKPTRCAFSKSGFTPESLAEMAKTYEKLTAAHVDVLGELENTLGSLANADVDTRAVGFMYHIVSQVDALMDTALERSGAILDSSKKFVTKTEEPDAAE